MSSYGDRKRKAAPVSDETDESPRLTKELKAPPRTTKSNEGASEQGSPGLLDLPAGVLAKVAQFIGIVDESDDRLAKGSLTLMALCVTVGREVARVIRREYLHNNLEYLNYLWGHVQIKQKMARREKGNIDDSTFLTVLKAALEQWMEENDWWKDACRDAVLFAPGGEMRTHHPPICKTIILNHDFDKNYDEDDFFESIGEYRSIFFVNNVNVRAMKPDVIEELLQKEGEKTIRVVLSFFMYFFMNPPLAIDLGMIDLLKFQVEDLKEDINSQKCKGIFFFPLPGGSQYGLPLILHAIVHPDECFLEYLLSVEHFEANPMMERDLDGANIRSSTGNTFLHELYDIVDHDLLPREMKLDRIKVLLQRKEVNVDIQNTVGDEAFETHTPLETCCMYAREGAKRNELLKIYLTHGARVSDFALDEAWRRHDREMYDLLQEHRSRS